jgi:hypothetical protein
MKRLATPAALCEVAGMKKIWFGSGPYQAYLVARLEAGHSEGGENQKDESDCQIDYDRHFPPPPYKNGRTQAGEAGCE